MFGIFGKKPIIHKVEAEAVAMELARELQDASNGDFVNAAAHLVKRQCEMMGILEELRDQEYREICQLAIRFKSGDRSRATVDATLKSF